MSAASLAERLGAFAAGVRYEALPAPTVTIVKRLLLDTLGCALGAVGAPPAQRVGEVVGAMNAPGRASLLGAARTALPEHAAWFNGTMVRYLDFNDVYFSNGVTHPSDAIPAALACVQEAGGSGRDLIEAIVVGYEARLWLCDALDVHALHLHDVSGAGFVVPLVAGKAWHQTAVQMAHGCVLGGARHLTMYALVKGKLSMAKAIAYPMNAGESITAARLAGTGFTGPLGALDALIELGKGSDGYRETPFAGESSRIERVSVKAFPIQFSLQAPVAAALRIHAEMQGRASEIARVVATVPAHHMNTADAAKFRPANRETADHSLPACVAMALLDGELTLGQFERGRFADPDVAALIDRFEAVPGSEAFAAAPGGRPGQLEVTLADGTRFSALEATPHGDALRPFDDAAVERKFRMLAEPHIGAGAASRAIELVAGIDERATIDALFEPLQIEVPA